MSSGGHAAEREVLIEFVGVSGLVKCSAIDTLSGLEVSVFGPGGTPRPHLERLAVRKLESALGRAATR